MSPYADGFTMGALVAVCLTGVAGICFASCAARDSYSAGMKHGSYVRACQYVGGAVRDSDKECLRTTWEHDREIIEHLDAGEKP